MILDFEFGNSMAEVKIFKIKHSIPSSALVREIVCLKHWDMPAYHRVIKGSIIVLHTVSDKVFLHLSLDE